MLVPFIRTLILYAAIIAAVRFMGKRQVGELQPCELAITILISAVASVPLQDIDIPLAHGLVPILTLTACEIVISAVSQGNLRFRRMMTGNPVPVIKDGVFIQSAVAKLRLSIDDILASLRLGGVFDIRDVKLAQVETNGQVSILLKDERQPLTCGLMNIKQQPSGPFYTLISDGRVISSNLVLLSKSEKWLMSIIKASGVQSADSIFFLCADIYGNTVLSRKEN